MELWTHVKLDSVHVIVMINVTNLHLYIYRNSNQGGMYGTCGCVTTLHGVQS